MYPTHSAKLPFSVWMPIVPFLQHVYNLPSIVSTLMWALVSCSKGRSSILENACWCFMHLSGPVIKAHDKYLLASSSFEECLQFPQLSQTDVDHLTNCLFAKVIHWAALIQVASVLSSSLIYTTSKSKRENLLNFLHSTHHLDIFYPFHHTARAIKLRD